MRTDRVDLSGLTSDQRADYTRWWNREYYHQHRATLRLQQKGYYGDVHRRAHYKRKYGVTLEFVDALHEKQNGCCAICGAAAIVLAVDHDHATGRVRGLLCRPCNSALGLLRENIPVLQRAISYLTQHGATQCQTTL